MNDPQNNLTSLSMDRCIRLAEIEGDHTVIAGAPDPQNEPRTCPYCDQPRQDTFENQFRFECGTKLRHPRGEIQPIRQGDVCRLRVELRAAQAELADRQDSDQRVLSEQCPSDEKHCACVPTLRRELETTQAEALELREALLAMREYYKEHMITGKLHKQVEAALDKKEGER